MIEPEDKRHERRKAVLLFLLAPVFLLAVLGTLFLLVLLSDPDIAKAYPNPEQHTGVQRFKLKTPPTASQTRSLPHRDERFDFDGDGVPDALTLEYFHMEPLLRPTTSGMVFVHCGATGAMLLAHAVPTPLDLPRWYGDHDGNGTIDVLVRSPKTPGGVLVLGALNE